MEFKFSETMIRTWIDENTGEMRMSAQTARSRRPLLHTEVLGLVQLILTKTEQERAADKLLAMDGEPQVTFRFTSGGRTIHDMDPGIFTDPYYEAAMEEAEPGTLEREFYESLPESAGIDTEECLEPKEYKDNQIVLDEGTMDLSKFISRFALDQDDGLHRFRFALQYVTNISDGNHKEEGQALNLENVLTAREASEMWGIAPTTLISAFAGQKKGDKKIKSRFNSWECRQSGATWLVTKTGMHRVYGESLVEKLNQLLKGLDETEEKIEKVKESEPERRASLERELDKKKEEARKVVLDARELKIIRTALLREPEPEVWKKLHSLEDRLGIRPIIHKERKIIRTEN